MSYTRQDIENIIARNKKKNTSKSPSPPFSAKSKQKNRLNSPNDISIRYQQLCKKYKELLEQVKDKNQKFKLQQTELQRLKSEKQRDQKQLYRLRSIIGLIKKQDKGLQVNFQMQSGGSWSTGIQKSVISQTKKEFDWETPIKNSQSSKLIQRISPSNKEINKTFNKSTFCSINTKQKQMVAQFYQTKNETLYSPNDPEKYIDRSYKLRQSRNMQQKSNKLSNSPYSKLRFSRKIKNLQ